MQSSDTADPIDVDLDNLPAAPQLLIKLIDILLGEQASFEELESIISRDSALSAKVLSVANSVAYRQWNESLELRQILVALGTRAIKSLALTSAVHQFFSRYEEHLGDVLQQVWFEALLVAHSARRIAELVAHPHPAEARMIGLLHGIGKLVLLNRQPKAYLQLLEQPVTVQELPLLEQREFGVSSAELTGRVFAHWGLPAGYQQAAHYQHVAPLGLRDMPLLVKIINTSVRACYGLLHPDAAEAVDDRLFGFNQSVIDELLADARRAALEEATTYGIDAGIGDRKPPEAGGERQAQRAPVQRELARRVHRIALIDGIQPELCGIDDRAELLSALSRQLTLLFGIARAQFYLLDEDGISLVPVATGSGRELLPAHSIAFSDGQSLVASSLALREVQTLDREQATAHRAAIDRELLLALGTEALLFIPLSIGGVPCGTVVAGCPEIQFRVLNTQYELLLYFGQACAGALRQLAQRNQDAEREQALVSASQTLANRALAHEVSSPLTVISNYLEILSAREPGVSAGGEIGLIQQEIARITTLLTQFREPDAAAPRAEAVSLNDLVRQWLALLEPTLLKSRQLRVELALEEAMPPLHSEPGALRQILGNLLSNACEALPPGGCIRILTRAATVIDQAQYCELVVADDGPGVPAALVSGLFSPVTSTKGGTHQGLGLAITYQLVKRLGGTISYRRASGGGAEFAVLIPAENTA